MRRYAKLMWYFFRFSLARTVQFQFDFFFRIVMDIIYYAAGIGFFKVLFLHSDQLGGWTAAQVMVFITGYFVIDALNMIFVSSNTWQLPYLVNRGELDYYLLRPVSSFFFLSFREINLASSINLIAACGLFGWSLSQLPVMPSLSDFAFFGAGMLLGLMLMWLFQMLFILPVFWLHSIEGLRGLMWNCFVFAERPDGIYRGFLRRILTTVLPYALIGSFPMRLLFNGNKWQTLGHLAIVTMSFLLLNIGVWQRGLRAYSSASS